MATVAPIAGRYELRALLADDGVKQVWSAFDRQLERDVSVEVATTLDADLQARFLAHAKLLAAENHPHLVTVYDTGNDNGQAFAVLEPVAGANLEQRLHDGPAFSLPQVVELGIALCLAAGAALQRELELEPLDPNDILLRDGDHVKLTNLLLRPPAISPSASGSPASEQPLVAQVAALLVAALQPPGAPLRSVVRANDLPATLPATMRTIVLAAIATRGASIRTLSELRQALSDYRGAAISTTRAFTPTAATAGAPVVGAGFGSAGALPVTRAMPASRRVSAAAAGRPRPRPSVWSPVIGVVVILALLGAAFLFYQRLGAADIAPPSQPIAADTAAPPTPVPVPGGGIVALLQRPSATPTAGGSPSPAATATSTPPPPAVVVVGSPTVGGARGTATALAQASATAGGPATATMTANPSGTPTPDTSATPATSPTPNTPTPIATDTPVPTAAVPMVVGRSVADATQILSQAGFAVVRLPDQQSASAPAGTILSEDPPATSIVPLGTAIRVTASSGSPLATVPSVIGKTQQNAEADLSALGLTAKVSQAPSSSVPEGNVINQNPAPGTAVQPGSAVRLTVSAGARIAVPNVVGMAEQQAQQTIKNSGLTPTFPNRSGTSTAVQPGQVESESPTAGTLVPPGTTVFINVRSS